MLIAPRDTSLGAILFIRTAAAALIALAAATAAGALTFACPYNKACNNIYCEPDDDPTNNPVNHITSHSFHCT
jgi:hypothetical protein